MATETPDPQDPGAVGKTQDTYYAQVLAGIGAPVTQGNLNVLKAWQQAEGSSSRWNAFNTTQPSKAKGTTDYNSIGVKNYPTQKAGIDATVSTLKLNYYTAMVAALKANDQEAFIKALVASPWDGGYGGRGANKTYKNSSVYSRFMAVNGHTGTQSRSQATHGTVTHAGVQTVDLGTTPVTPSVDINPVTSLTGFYTGTERLIRILTDGSFWVRVLEMAGGAFIIFWGVTILTSNQLGLDNIKGLVKGAIPA